MPQGEACKVTIKALGKAGCLEILHVRFGVGAWVKLPGPHHCFLEAQRQGRAPPFCTPSWQVPSDTGLSHGLTCANFSCGSMQMNRNWMRCCPIVGPPLTPSMYLRIDSKNHEKRPPERKSDVNEDALKDGPNSIRGFLALDRSPPCQLMTQYAPAERLLNPTSPHPAVVEKPSEPGCARLRRLSELRFERPPETSTRKTPSSQLLRAGWPWLLALAVTHQGSHRSGGARTSAAVSSADRFADLKVPEAVQASCGDMLIEPRCVRHVSLD